MILDKKLPGRPKGSATKPKGPAADEKHGARYARSHLEPLLRGASDFATRSNVGEEVRGKGSHEAEVLVIVRLKKPPAPRAKEGSSRNMKRDPDTTLMFSSTTGDSSLADWKAVLGTEGLKVLNGEAGIVHYFKKSKKPKLTPTSEVAARDGKPKNSDAYCSSSQDSLS
jgi:hypothetical protein